MTTPTLAMAGHAVPPAGGQLAAGAAGSGVGEVSVKAPLASGPTSAPAGTPPPAQPAEMSGFKAIGCPQVDAAGVAALPQLV